MLNLILATTLGIGSPISPIDIATIGLLPVVEQISQNRDSGGGAMPVWYDKPAPKKEIHVIKIPEYADDEAEEEVIVAFVLSTLIKLGTL